MITVVIQREDQDVRIPKWAGDLAGFRRWAKSDEFPEHGWYAYLDGDLWVDPSMEKLSHNQIKTEISNVLGPLTKGSKGGLYVGDRMLLTNVQAGLSTEPDGMFVSYETLKSGRAVFEDAEESLEAVGIPDMVLEVVSGTSLKKDTVVLRELYARAGIGEYWLADSRSKNFAFQILHFQGLAFAAAPVDQDGWTTSKVFGRSFRLIRETDPVGLPVFRLEAK
jgi:Uma2 family endonuclease